MSIRNFAVTSFLAVAFAASTAFAQGSTSTTTTTRNFVFPPVGLGSTETAQVNVVNIATAPTGWGHSGPLADAAGHDINYIALTGALHGIGNAGGKPVPPLNLVGDFGGGALYLAFGVVCGLLDRKS